MTFWLFAGVFLGACTQTDPSGSNTTQGPNTTQSPNTSQTPQPSPSTGSTSTPQSGNSVTPNPNTATDPQGSLPLPQGANVRFSGRVDAADANGPIIAWPGSQIIIGFSGTSLTVNLKEMDRARYNGVAVNNYFGVAVDGVAQSRVKLTSTATSYLVASALSPGQHQVVLTKLTEAQIGRVQYQGSSTDGALTFTTAASDRRLEFIGDSGTAGYGSGGTFPCVFSAATEDASVAYPAVVANLLNADVHNLSYSGKGLVQNRDMQNDNVKTLPVLWERTLPNDEDATPYNPSGWAPQAVVMTLGGNDFFTQVLDEATFNGKLIAFIRQVQAQYPGTHVYVGVSPMLRRDDPHPGQRQAGIAYAQAAVAAVANSRVHYIELPEDVGTNGYGCDQHMTPATHRAIANAIVPVFKAQFGW